LQALWWLLTHLALQGDKASRGDQHADRDSYRKAPSERSPNVALLGFDARWGYLGSFHGNSSVLSVSVGF